MSTLSLLGTTTGLGFTAGLNLYATVLAAGLGIRFGFVQLPNDLQGLGVLANPAILTVAGVLYSIEFFADKIPFVEHVWDLFHSLIRPVGAAWIALIALGHVQMNAVNETLLVLLVGGTALTAHLGKAGSRIAAASAGGHLLGANLFLSVVEDIVSVTIAPLALSHPRTTLLIVSVGLAGFAFLLPVGYRYLRSVFAAVRWGLQHKVIERDRRTLERHHLPQRVAHTFDELGVSPGGATLILPATVSGVRGIPRGSAAYIALDPSGMKIVCCGVLKVRTASLSFPIPSARVATGLFGHNFLFDQGRKRVRIAFFPLTAQMATELCDRLPTQGDAALGANTVAANAATAR